MEGGYTGAREYTVFDYESTRINDVHAASLPPNPAVQKVKLMNRTISLLALLSITALAQGAPAPAPSAGEAAAPPAGGTATTSTTKGGATKKEKPTAPPEASKAPEKK